MTVKTLYVTQGGGTAIYDTLQKAYFFLEVPDFGEFKTGDRMPEEWSIAKCGQISVGEIEEMGVTERDGYEAGYAGKTDPNPFMVDTYNYWEYAAGRARGDRERLVLDQQETGADLKAAFHDF